MMKDVFTRLGGVHPLRVSSEGFLSEKKIGEIEEYLGFTLPKDYREFLAAYGHVAFNNTIVFTPEEKTAIYPHNDETGLTNPEFLGSQVSHFFGADHDYTATLECKIEVYEDRMPRKVIPIAEDGLGNKICISGNKDTFGFIYWWDHEHEWDEDDYKDTVGREMPEEAKYQNVYLVAKSFSGFLEKLAKVKD